MKPIFISLTSTIKRVIFKNKTINIMKFKSKISFYIKFLFHIIYNNKKFKAFINFLLFWLHKNYK
jgi:hypothetical protein